MELFFTGNSMLMKGTPKELRAYLEEAALKYRTIEELIRANLH